MSSNGMESSGKVSREHRDKIKRITAVGWGAFFVWLGFVLMIKAGSGAILIEGKERE